MHVRLSQFCSRMGLCMALLTLAPSHPTLAAPIPVPGPHIGVLGGGPLYTRTAEVTAQLRAAGFTTVMLWTLHISANGDLIFNDIPLIHAGQYIGDPSWPKLIAGLKTPPSSIDRLEFAVGSGGGPNDFSQLQKLIASSGTGAGSILRQNFLALKMTLPDLAAIDFDDESLYDVDTTTAFTAMLADLGLHVTLCPYTAQDFWHTVYQTANAANAGTIDRVYLQAYDGGTGNTPSAWNALFPDLQVDVGLWSRHGDGCADGDDPSSVKAKLAPWRAAIAGGWLWLLDDMLACSSTYTLKDYAAALTP